MSKHSFQDLPYDIRMEIYPWLLMSGEPWWPSRQHCHNYINRHPTEIIYPEILRTCKMCYHEAIHFLYSKCHFYAKTGEDLRSFNMGFVPTIGPANAARIKSIDGRYLFSSTVQRKCLNSYHDLITRHIYLKEMMAMLRACPNLEYFEIHVGDQRHRCNLRVLGHLVKIILQSHPTLTRAIEYLGTSQVSGMSPNDWCALVGKRDKLPNGRKLSHYRLLMDITTGYRVNIVGSNPWTDMVWTGEIPPRFESTQYPSRDYTIEDTVLAGTVLENTEDYNDDEFVVDGDDNLEERDMITIGEGGIYGVEVWREEEKIPLGHFTDANRVYMAPGFPVAVRISRDC